MDVFHRPKNVLNVAVTVQDKTRRGGAVYEILTHAGEPWPTNTQRACWRCSHRFDTPPVGIPCAPNSRRLVGNFCSFNCAYAWALNQSGHHTDYTAACRLKQHAQEVHQVNPEDIVPSPDPLVLELFGGSMSIERYRANNLPVYVTMEPFVSSHMLLCVHQPRTPSEPTTAEEPVAAENANEPQFKVTGLRRPSEPLPLEKVLCEQNMGTRKGIFEEYAQNQACGGTQPSSPVVVSRGKGNPKGKNVVNNLARFVRSSNKNQAS